MLNRTLKLLIAALVLVFALPVSAFADDWVAAKLRGIVLQFVDGDWAELNRGDVVPDDRVIRTLPSGRVDFQRGSETISLGASTQVQIKDRAGQRYTTVKQFYGTVEVEAEVRNVKHFAVETPFLAAVVKGTHFIVKSGKASASVQVKRGRVEVTDAKTGANALVLAGQTATVTAEGSFSLKGRGANKTEILGANGVAIAAGGAGSGGVSVGAEVGDPASVEVGVGEGGVDLGVDVVGNDVDMSVGGGDSISVNVGGIGISLGGGLF